MKIAEGWMFSADRLNASRIDEFVRFSTLVLFIEYEVADCEVMDDNIKGVDWPILVVE